MIIFYISCVYKNGYRDRERESLYNKKSTCKYRTHPSCYTISKKIHKTISNETRRRQHFLVEISFIVISGKGKQKSYRFIVEKNKFPFISICFLHVIAPHRSKNEKSFYRSQIFSNGERK